MAVHTIEKIRAEIEEIWENDKHFSQNQIEKSIYTVFELLECGKVCVVEKCAEKWKVNEWIKKAILLSFRYFPIQESYDGVMRWRDKIALKGKNSPTYDQNRLVPGCFVRQGVYLGNSVVVMPSCINIGAHIGERTMIDMGANIGSCAYIGKSCHIAAHVTIGGVLEPLQHSPVIIEDNCFIGSGSQILEGAIVGEGSVLGAGVHIGASIKIIDRQTEKISYGKIPPHSVVIPGALQTTSTLAIACAVITKQVTPETREKTSITELLRQ